LSTTVSGVSLFLGRGLGDRREVLPPRAVSAGGIFCIAIGPCVKVGHLQRRQPNRVFRIVFVALLMFATATGVRSQGCNPAFDGTYCASASYEHPAKLGTITFGGGTSCIGLLCRVSCN